MILYEKNFSGVYLDENNEPNLKIVKHSQGDMYHIEIGIYRLTNLDDGKGRADFDVLEFVATDANGNPIEGEITFRNDTAEVTFTHSTWPLLKNGSKFHYVRQREAKADKEKTYLNAVEEYLTDEIRRHYTDGDICIPFYTIIDVDDSNRDDIKVKGDFWVLNYNLVGDTLKCVSGGNYLRTDAHTAIRGLLYRDCFRRSRGWLPLHFFSQAHLCQQVCQMEESLFR